jgi:hypothetical protein
MKFFITAALCVFVMISCRHDDLNYQKHQSTIIVDSLILTDGLQLHDGNLPFSLYGFLYIGKMRDTIRLPRLPISDYADESGNGHRRDDYILADESNLAIDVDTTTIFAAALPRNDKNDSLSFVKAYGIFVRNLSSQTIFLGLFGNLRAVQQVQTPDGKWFNIETPNMYFCGTGARQLFLESNDIGIAKFMRGNGKVKLRSRLMFENCGSKIYSNIFFDRVDSIPTDHLTSEKIGHWLDAQQNKSE